MYSQVVNHLRTPPAAVNHHPTTVPPPLKTHESKKDIERRENVRKYKTLDYDSQELKRLLSHVSLNGDREKGRFYARSSTGLYSYLLMNEYWHDSTGLMKQTIVFQVFQKWSDGLDSGVLRSDDIDYLKKKHGGKGNGDPSNCARQVGWELVHFLRYVTREAIYDGLSDSCCKTSLVSWALPYAQRFIYSNHQNEYSQLKLSGFKKLNCLKIVVVEKLFCRNVVKRFGIKSTAGIPESPLTKFLDLITTMKESGFTEKQLESRITNVQNLTLLPNEESQWSVSSMPSPVDDKITPTANSGLSLLDVNTRNSKVYS
ncbi:hypothetical protein Tco_1251402 [Tanacetum coccineum]